MRDDLRRELEQVEQVAREIAREFGLEIVEFVFHNRGRHSQLRIDIDRPGPIGVGLADCERLSRAIDERLEVLGFFDAPYELQVSSPGLDRPIRSDDDIRRNTGRTVRVTARGESGGQKEWAGTLAGLSEDDRIMLATGDGIVSIPRNLIVSMKQDISTSRSGHQEG